jgi:hypothetical protein
MYNVHFPPLSALHELGPASVRNSGGLVVLLTNLESIAAAAFALGRTLA